MPDGFIVTTARSRVDGALGNWVLRHVVQPLVRRTHRSPQQLARVLVLVWAVVFIASSNNTFFGQIKTGMQAFWLAAATAEAVVTVALVSWLCRRFERELRRDDGETLLPRRVLGISMRIAQIRIMLVIIEVWGVIVTAATADSVAGMVGDVMVGLLAVLVLYTLTAFVEPPPKRARQSVLRLATVRA